MDRILILLSIIVFSIHADDFACKNAKYTIEINECKMAEVKKAEILLEKYILASKKHRITSYNVCYTKLLRYLF